MNRFDDSHAPKHGRLKQQPCRPDGRGTGSSGELDSFGFDLPDDGWMDRVRRAETRADLGQIGSYVLIEEINRGAQGIVYRARQPSTNRDIAIKRLAAGRFATDAMRARFSREIETAASLSHPNVVRVYGTDIVGDQPVLAMEWIDGQPVDRWAKQAFNRRRDARTVLHVFAAICDAVHYAHQRGVIHRDLKPSNILIDAEDQPHVLDFGLAKLIDEDDSAAAHLTLTRDFVGTPAYASPEQVRGGAAHVDVRSDVYALGVLLYQMLTGRLPYPNDRNLADLLTAIKDHDPPPPSQVNPRLDREIDAIVLKALAKAPDRRYASVDGFSADVKRYLGGEPVLAHPSSVFYQLSKLVRRHLAVSMLATAVVVLIVAFGVTATTQALRLERQRAAAVDAEHRETEARAAAEEVNEFLRQMLSAARPQNAQGQEITVGQLVDQAMLRADGAFDQRPSVEAAVRLTLGETLFGLGRHGDAERQLERALTLHRDLYGSTHSDTAWVLLHLGHAKRAEGRYDEAMSHYEEALRTFRSLPDEGLRLAATLDSLATANLERGDLPAAESLLIEAQAIRAAHPEARIEDEIQGALLLSSTLFHRGDFESAERHLLRALEQARAGLGNRHELTLTVLGNLSLAVKRQGRPEEARPYAEECLETARVVFGDDHPHTLQISFNLASLLQSLKAHAEAEALYEALLRRFDERQQMDHPSAIAGANNLGSLLLELERHEEAEPLLRETLERAQRVFGPRHPDTATTMVLLAKAIYRGNTEVITTESRALLSDALTILESSLPADHPQIAKTRKLLSEWSDEHTPPDP